MSGRFKPKRTLVRLTFEDPELEGLEVLVRPVSMGTLMTLLSFEDVLGEDGKGLTPADLGKFTEVLRLFARMLASWNLDDDDEQPVPATYEGLVSQDPDFVVQIITQAAAAMVKAPPPLPGGSPSGETSEAVPPPAVVSASRSLASLQEPS